MRKGSVVFLILVLSSAVMVGTTLGLISNMSYLKPYLQNKSPSTPDNGLESSSPVEPPRVETGQHQSSPGKHQVAETPEAVVSQSNDTPATSRWTLTEAEAREIHAMLAQLGYGGSSSLSQAVTLYQKAKHLPANGCLDTDTLNSIVRELTKKKATGLAFNSR